MNDKNEVTKKEITDEIQNFAFDTNLNLTDFQLNGHDVYELYRLCKKLDIYMNNEGINCTSELIDETEE